MLILKLIGVHSELVGARSEIDWSLVQHIGDGPDSMPAGSLSYLFQSQLKNIKYTFETLKPLNVDSLPIDLQRTCHMFQMK